MINRKKAAVIIIAFVALFIVTWNVLRSPLEKKVAACRKYFWPYWKVWSVQENNEQKHIEIVYDEYLPSKNQNICIKKTCNALYKLLLEEQTSQYHDYTMDICFRIAGEAETLSIYNMTADLTAVRICNARMTSMPLKTIVEIFPYARELSVEGVNYHDSIPDIKGFEDLEYFYCRLYLSKEEKDYIHSLYPDCVIECLEEN